ncbi:MAG: aconitate hydratase AcnA [Thermodesulfobacteriota bacterium]|nr:aconitate hydratase AcnA [Thermodesulfobacteriota bacterium]
MPIFKNSFGARSILNTPDGPVIYFSLDKLSNAGLADLDRLPFCIKILLENLVRNKNSILVTADDVENIAKWSPNTPGKNELPFMPARILLQDFTGVPALVDMAGMRDAAGSLNFDPMKINPDIPVELVIDHSVQVDSFGSTSSFEFNIEKEFQRNSERYAFLRWGQKNFSNFRVVPPGTGIIHQVNLEYLARVVFLKEDSGQMFAFPDSLIGLDSHTTMINGIGVLGWGVGGIEAEAVMLGQPYYMLPPQVVGCRLTNSLADGVTTTDLVLTITELLRQKGVVGKFVEFYGPGIKNLSSEDRATIANMAPEYGATTGFFPVDDETINYLRLSGRPEKKISLIEHYCKAQGLFRTETTPEPVFTDIIHLDMSTIEPSMAGPSRPQERIPLYKMKQAFHNSFKESYSNKSTTPSNHPAIPAFQHSSIPASNHPIPELTHGSVVIAAITSCTNTSNTSVMIGAGLLAKKAVERGLSVKPWVKTSLAPGSKVVTEYLEAAGLLPFFNALRFNLVAYGCTSCIGNSGPLSEPVTDAINKHNLVAVSVLSGNRNFEGRISPHTRANYLASPPLVVAYAIAGTVDIDFKNQPIASGSDGKPVYLHEIWPSKKEIIKIIKEVIKPEMYSRAYASIFEGSNSWKAIPVPKESFYNWNPESTYIKEPPFFKDISPNAPELRDINEARILALLGDNVTTDHISPAGTIPVDSPAGSYLTGRGIKPSEFNSFGSRRGNHEVMLRGAFGNIRLKNRLTPDINGKSTVHLPEGKKMSIYDAAMQYRKEGIPLLIMAGKNYGAGSSRDWAAKGTALLGVKAIVAESFERIHRSNLVCMGILPLQFMPGENHESLNLDGTELYSIKGIRNELKPDKELMVSVHGKNGEKKEFRVIARIDSPVEIDYYRHGGILAYVLRGLKKD